MASRPAEGACLFAVQIQPMRERTIDREIARPGVDDKGIRPLSVDPALDEYAIVFKRKWNRRGLELGRCSCGVHGRRNISKQKT